MEQEPKSNRREFLKDAATMFGVGVAATAFPEILEATQLEIAQAQTEVKIAELAVKNAKTPEEKATAQKTLIEKKGKLEEAKAKTKDQKQAAKDAEKNAKAGGKDDIFNGDKPDAKVSYKENIKYDEKGRVTERTILGSDKAHDLIKKCVLRPSPDGNGTYVDTTNGNKYDDRGNFLGGGGSTGLNNNGPFMPVQGNQ